MSTCTYMLFAGIFLLSVLVQLSDTTECYDCSGCKIQISGSTDCPEFCKKPGSSPDDEFVKRCSQKFFCAIDACYCSDQACSGAQLVKIPVFVLLSYMCVTFSLKYIL